METNWSEFLEMESPCYLWPRKDLSLKRKADEDIKIAFPSLRSLHCLARNECSFELRVISLIQSELSEIRPLSREASYRMLVRCARSTQFDEEEVSFHMALDG